MKKRMMLLVLCAGLMAGCSSGGISQEQYESVVAERNALKAEIESLKLSKNNEAASETEESEVDNEKNAPKLSSSELLEKISVKEYTYANFIGTNWYLMEITNNSDVTIQVETNVVAKDADGNTVGAASGEEGAIESGYTVCIPHMFDEIKPETYEYTISVNEEEYHSPVLSDLQYEASDTGDKLIVSCTNNGEKPAEFVKGLVLFFKGDQLLGHSSNYFTDDDSELKSGNTLAKEFEIYSDEQYDNYKVYLTGRR